MKRRSAFRFVVIAGAVLFFLAGLGAWQSNFTIRSDVRLVVLDVSVKDPAGGFVSGLERENFTILEDGHRQPITVFANEDLPVTVGILVDESLSMRPKRADVLQAAETFIEASNPKDEIFVLNFNDRVTRGLPDRLPFSDNIVQLRSALHRGLPQGKTALNDAVVAGVKQLEMGRRDKKALVVISDGGDNASRHNRGDMLNAVESSTATIYTVGIFEPDDPDRDPGVLNKLG